MRSVGSTMISALESALRSDRGSASVELVVLVIPIMVLVAFAVFVGRYGAAQQDVTSAARDAARAAAVRQFPAAAQVDGQQAAERTLVNRDLTCRQLDIEVATDDLRPGGTVTARITCVLLISDVAGFGMPGSTTVEATSTAVVDHFRGGEPNS
ncbi:MAG: pilus assembly protein [Actinomycetia bacterium]|nr:pilus assembly protein [Actinomycetes bacterium]